MDENDNDYKPFRIDSLIKVAAILFVLGIYTVIFLKILFLK